MTKRLPSVIFITGASRGIGRALALSCARPHVSLFLTGRDQFALRETARAAEAKGAAVRTFIADVRDAGRMAEVAAEADRTAPLELVIANAGVNRTGEEDLFAGAREVFDVNVMGVVNTVMPMLEPMRARRRGQLALMSSLSGLRREPYIPSYSASKAAVRIWGEALRVALKPYGISVSVVCPGRIETGMTADLAGEMLKAQKAAETILAGLAEERAMIAFPAREAMTSYAKALVPASFLEWARRFG